MLGYDQNLLNKTPFFIRKEFNIVIMERSALDSELVDQVYGLVTNSPCVSISTLCNSIKSNYAGIVYLKLHNKWSNC